MITLLLLAQITREEFLDFKKQAEIQFVRIDERFNKIEAEIQALNQRINYTNERIDDFIGFIRREKADKIELNKIEKKLEELEIENISIIEKIVNGVSKDLIEILNECFLKINSVKQLIVKNLIFNNL